MSEEISAEFYKSYKISIYSDELIDNPRDFMAFGKMICFHKRYNLGDKHSIRYQDYDGWSSIKSALIKDEHAEIILPLFLMDHGSISIRTSSFSCPWDSGQVGFIYTTKEKIREHYGRKRISVKTLELAKSELNREVEVYNSYISGEGCRYEINDEGDSCGGYYNTKTAILDAKQSIDNFILTMELSNG